MRAAKALASLHVCADSPELLLLKDVLSTKIVCAGSCVHIYEFNDYYYDCNIMLTSLSSSSSSSLSSLSSSSSL